MINSLTNVYSVFRNIGTSFFFFLDTLIKYFKFISPINFIKHVNNQNKLSSVSELVDNIISDEKHEIIEENEVQEEKNNDQEEDDLMKDIQEDSKQMYFNRDEIHNMFNESREQFAKAITLQEKMYFFTKFSNFQIRKMDKIIKEELDKLITTETDEVFLSILKNVDWSISKEYYTKHFYNCKLLYYKLISAKPLFQKVFYDDFYTHKEKLRNIYNDTLNFLMGRAKDENESINIRAECLDTIITYGRNKERTEAEEIIKELGQLYTDNKDRTIYTNSQNVHSHGVQKTAISSLINLATYHRPKENIDLIYEMVLNKLVDKEEKREKVIKALKRIILDPTLFQGFNISQVLSIVWQEIERLSKYKDELESRLIEELYDSDETCSSGYFTRIINVLSGFSVHVKIGISPEEELISRVVQYIKNRISKLEYLDRERLSLEIVDEDPDPNSFRMKLKSQTRDSLWADVIEANNYTEKIKEEHLKEMIELKLDSFFGK